MTTKSNEYFLVWAITISTVYIGAKQTTNANCTHSALYTAFLNRAMFSVFVWLAGCLSRTCAWWYLRMQKIFAYDASDITRQNDVTKELYRKIIGWWKNPLKEATRLKTQKVVKIIYVRFKVTICLYLSPNITSVHAYGRHRHQSH